MRVDIVKSESSPLVTTTSILYAQMRTGSEDFTPFQVVQTAPFGGVTTEHLRLRERFAVIYERSEVTKYSWSNVEFVKATDDNYYARLQQDNQLDYGWWFRGSNGTGTFGSGGGQFDLTLVDDESLKGYLTTLCTQDDVEQLALSHLQGRIRFSDGQATDGVGPFVMTADDLWQRIYMVSAAFAARLSKYYVLPLRLGTDVDKRRVADYAAREVFIFVLTSLNMVGGNRGLADLITSWRTEIEAFLTNPTGLNAEARSLPGGTFRVERA